MFHVALLVLSDAQERQPLPPRHQPGHDRQGPNANERTPKRHGLSGRMAMQQPFTRSRYEYHRAYGKHQNS